jgi:hypothetical protein
MDGIGHKNDVNIKGKMAAGYKSSNSVAKLVVSGCGGWFSFMMKASPSQFSDVIILRFPTCVSNPHWRPCCFVHSSQGVIK